MKPRYMNNSRPPREGKGFIIASLKDLFRLVDNYPTKMPYSIAWTYVFEDYDWIWVSPRVMKSLDTIKPFDVREMKKWDGNLVLLRGFQSKFAKLTQPLPEFFDGEYRVRNFFGKTQTIVGYVGDGVNDKLLAKSRKSILDVIKKIQISANLDWVHDLYKQKNLNLKINIIFDEGNWSVNYANSVIEFNANTFSRKGAREAMLIVLKGFSLAYFSLILRPKDMKAWFTYIKRKNPIVKENHYKKDITKLQMAWANGMSFHVMGYRTMYIQQEWHNFHNIKWSKLSPSSADEYSISDLNLTPDLIESNSDVLEFISEEYGELPFDFDVKAMYDVTGLGDVLSKTAVGDELGLYVGGDQKVVINDVSHSDVRAFVIEAENDDYGEGWRDSYDEKIFTMSRTVWWNDEKSGIENDVFKLHEDFRGKGVGMTMIGRQIQWCIDNYIDQISCFAARDASEGYIGYKVWHKMGYDAAIDSEERTWDAFEEELKKFVHRSLEKKILDFPESVIYGEMNTLLKTLTNEKKVKAFRELPPQFEDRYLSIRYGNDDGSQPPNDYSDLVSEMLRVEIYEFFLKFSDGNSNVPSTKECSYFEEKKDIDNNLSAFRLHPTIETMQNLMDLEGFFEWWEINGKGYKCKIDLREGTNSEAYMIFALYQEEKLKSKRMSSGDILTKAMGTLSSVDIALMDKARKEIRMRNRSINKLATKWLS